MFLLEILADDDETVAMIKELIDTRIRWYSVYVSEANKNIEYVNMLQYDWFTSSQKFSAPKFSVWQIFH